MLQTKRIDIYCDNKKIKLKIQMDLPEAGYSNIEKDIELHGILVMYIEGNKSELLPVMYKEDFRELLIEELQRITKEKIINIPEEAWPEKWEDWETVVS